MLVAEGVGTTYRCSLSVVILTGVPRRCGGAANGPLIVSVDFQLSAPELAVEACRSAATSRLVIVVRMMVVSDMGAPLPSESSRRRCASLGCCGLHCRQMLVRRWGTVDIEAAGNTGEELAMMVQAQAAVVGWSVDAALLFRCAERADDNWSWAARQSLDRRLLAPTRTNDCEG